MNDFYLGDNIKRKVQPMVDFNYNIQKIKSSRKSMFQFFAPNLNSKNVSNNNPKEIYNASNKINSILSKNLKSIYHENKNEMTKDTPLYENVKCLLKKSHNSNKYIYNQIINVKNSLNNNKYNKKESRGSSIEKYPEKKFRNSAIIRSNNKLKNEEVFPNSLKSSIVSKKKTALKSYYIPISSKIQTRISKNKKEQGILAAKKRNTSFISNYKYNKRRNTNFETQALIAHDKNKLNKLFNENSIISKSHNSSFISPINQFNEALNASNIKNIKNKVLSKKSIRANLHKKRLSANIIDNGNLKINKKNNTKIKATRYSVFVDPLQTNMKIPTLKQINSAITRSFIENRMETIRKELDDFEKNEISEIINKQAKNRNEKNKINSLESLSIKRKSENTISEKKELLSSKTKLDERMENKNIGENEVILQKKYRKLFLSKNLYDSFDDEEVVDEEKLYNFYISTNSLTVYLLDSLILIATFIELLYLPVYISLHITPFTIYSNNISSNIFYIIDLVYIIDLITGFFRAFYNFEEMLIKNNIQICINYLTGWFAFDLMEAIPFFTLLDKNMQNSRKNFIESNKDINNMFDYGLNNKYFGLTVLKIVKIFKIFTSNRVLIAVTKFLDKSHFFYEWKGLFSTLFITFSSLHFCTCFFIFVGRNEFQGWIVQNNIQDKSFIDIYVTSLYYQMTTLTTVGYGDISPTNGLEKVYGIFILIVGTCAYSWILTYISNYIKKNNEKFIDFEEKVKVLNEIKLEFPNLGKALFDRIKRYLNYNKSKYKFNLKFILESLPSSLQNNLIIEIYKPIIKNFQFFKSFENSDFFVKIVTSLKPILSMKDDILIQEGDIIEDIIFIKAGVLTLEVIIDLNEPKKSVESHLEMTGMNCFKNISNHKFTALMNLTTINSNYQNYQTEFGKQVFNNQYNKKKEIKIIDLRKNEHFGDILMILNEKSPLTVKVKSKKAELFFLQKTEATEISNRYPNIWKRIVNRSLHNMRQIKSLIRKKVFFYIETNNIEINPELKKRYLKNELATSIVETLISELKNKINSPDDIETIFEEDESNIMKSQTAVSEKNINQVSNLQSQRNKSNKSVENIVSENEKEYKNQIKSKKVRFTSTSQKRLINSDKKLDINFIKNKSFTKDKDNKSNTEKNEVKPKLKISFKEQSFQKEKSNKSIDFNNKNINGVNDMISIIDEVKKSNKSNQINNFNINIYTPKVQFPLNQINIENNNSSNYNKEEDKEEINNSIVLEKINSELSFGKDLIPDIKDNVILMDNSDENSNIIYSKIKYKENKVKVNLTTNVSDNNNSNIIKLFEKRKMEKILNRKNKNEKADIKTNDKTSIKSVSSDKSKVNMKNQDDNNFIEKNHKFFNLNTSKSTSFSISSLYDNINQISQYKYHQNQELRQKTKNFILEQINNKNKISATNIEKNNNNNNLLNITSNMKINVKNIVKKKFESSENKVEVYKNQNLTPRNKPMFKNIGNEDESKINMSKTFKRLEGNNIKRNATEESNKDSKKFNYVIIFNKKRNSSKKKLVRRRSSVDYNESTFYNKINRIKTMKKGLGINSEENNEKKSDGIKINYNKIISKNIEKNQQNLNNPEIYFEGFFNDIIFKKNQGNNLMVEKEIKKRKTFQK